jgi:hypothetical protein
VADDRPKALPDRTVIDMGCNDMGCNDMGCNDVGCNDVGCNDVKPAKSLTDATKQHRAQADRLIAHGVEGSRRRVPRPRLRGREGG